MRASGPTEEVANEYKEYSNQAIGKQLSAQSQEGSYRRWGSQEIEITAMNFLDASGSKQSIFKTGDEMVVEIAYTAHQPIRDPEFGLAIFRQDGIHINGPNSHLAGLETGLIEGPGVVQYHIKKLPLLPARYQVTAAIHDSRLMNAYDYHELAYSFRVVTGGTEETDGLIEIPATWEWLPTPN